MCSPWVVSIVTLHGARRGGDHPEHSLLARCVSYLYLPGYSRWQAFLLTLWVVSTFAHPSTSNSFVLSLSNLHAHSWYLPRGRSLLLFQREFCCSSWCSSLAFGGSTFPCLLFELLLLAPRSEHLCLPRVTSIFCSPLGPSTYLLQC